MQESAVSSAAQICTYCGILQRPIFLLGTNYIIFKGIILVRTWQVETTAFSNRESAFSQLPH